MTVLGTDSSGEGPAYFTPSYRPMPEHEPLVLPVPCWLADAWTGFRTRRHLNRLERRLNRLGWQTKHLYQCSPPLLRVFSEAAPSIGEHLSAVRGTDGWAYWSSTGDHLADCDDTINAAHALTTCLGPWLVAILTTKPVQD
ncbi:hypothetical protein AB0L06_30795 [Spirillospora sp. NPDC052269]